MIQLSKEGCVLTAKDYATRPLLPDESAELLRQNTMAYTLLNAHDSQDGQPRDELQLFADALASNENVYVNVLQTARASGLSSFPVPTVLFNDHNSLCSIGGTICEDDHMFGLSCAKRYGGIYVQPFAAVIHQFMREMIVSGGNVMIATDSHTRYGALGALGFGEGGGEMVRQLLGKPYRLKRPRVIAVRLKGRLGHGVGPHDVALALVGAVYASGYVKNSILEFIGDGINALSMDMRFDIDAMTTETSALSSIWETDERTEAFYQSHAREKDFRRMHPRYPAYYDGLIDIDLGKCRPMIALPFHPSNAWTIEDFRANASDLIHSVEQEGRRTMPTFSLSDRLEGGQLRIRQASVAGCAGGLYENLCAVANILRGTAIDSTRCRMHLYPASAAILKGLTETGVTEQLLAAGALTFQSYCGPCFGAQDIPCNNDIAIRHVTRNFVNREGSRPGAGQGSCVAIMDARSIAATVKNDGFLCGADTVAYDDAIPAYRFNPHIYVGQVYNGFGKPDEHAAIESGPNIRSWPAFSPLPDHLLVTVAGVYGGTLTSDDLLPSGEASAYRSNPEKLAEFTLLNTDPGYYQRARAIRDRNHKPSEREGDILERELGADIDNVQIGSMIVCERIGDGSAREQAASNQRVLGGRANLASEYCTRRYRGNLINWGILPLVKAGHTAFEAGDCILLRDIRQAVRQRQREISMIIYRQNGVRLEETASLGDLSPEESDLLIAGGLINHYHAEP